MNRIYFILLLISVLAASCSSDDSDNNYDPYDAIYSNTNQTQFEELLMLVNISVTHSSLDTTAYVVPDKLETVVIKINNRKWAEFATEDFDNDDIPTFEFSNMLLSSDKVQYLLVTGQSVEAPSGYTAGDYSDFLNGFRTLSPGDYICEIAQISFIGINGELITVKPHIYQFFQIYADTKTLFLGEFNIPLTVE